MPKKKSNKITIDFSNISDESPKNNSSKATENKNEEKPKKKKELSAKQILAKRGKPSDFVTESGVRLTVKELKFIAKYLKKLDSYGSSQLQKTILSLNCSL